MAETRFETQGAVLLAQSGGCAVWQFRSETGDVKLDLRLRHTGHSASRPTITTA